MTDCALCWEPFDEIASRWLCPNCKTKNSCCEGGPLPPAQFEKALDDIHAKLKETGVL